jgi:hypothetical protein
MLRRAAVLLSFASLAAVAACVEGPLGPFDHLEPSEPRTEVALGTGDPLDLFAVGVSDFGLHDGGRCASSAAEVATLVEEALLVAIAPGESMVTCLGAMQPGAAAGATEDAKGRAWVPFRVQVRVTSAGHRR